MTIFVDVTLEQRLRLAGIMVSYNGPASTAPGAPMLNLAAPTLTNLQSTAATTLLMFPVRSAGTYRTAGTVNWTLPLTDAPSCPGCCTPNWVALNTAVDAQRTADGNRTDVLYYGLMAPGIPMGPIIGCNTGGVSTGSANDGMTMAHELGHACGFAHAPCGTPGDPNYPAYEPYDPAGTPQASIGEYRSEHLERQHTLTGFVQGHDGLLRAAVDLAIQLWTPHQSCVARPAPDMRGPPVVARLHRMGPVRHSGEMASRPSAGSVDQIG